MLSANCPFLKSSILAATLLGLTVLPPAALAQHEHDNPSGYPLDWSNSHVKYRPAGNLQDQKNFEKDPRYLRHRDEEGRKWGKLVDDDRSGRGRNHQKKHGTGSDLTVDWAVSLANGAVAQSMSPAVFTSGSESCSDLAVYALNVTGNSASTTGAKQANLIGVNNLYTTCSPQPQVAFAYALTTGPIPTSPVFSFYDNGAQIAFVSNDAAGATLHVLTYSATASSANGTAASAPAATYPGTGSEKTLLISSAHTDTNSSPYIDYFNDAAYVGDDNGNLFKISPVFGTGAPAKIWTVALAVGTKLTGPVLDNANGVVLVGSSNGNLYARLSSTGASVTGSPLAVGDGSAPGTIADPPVIVEEGSGLTTDVFLTTNCAAAGLPAADGIIYEASETPSAVARLTALQIGNAKGCGSNVLHAPALDDSAYNGVAGHGYVCGTNIQTTTNPSNEPPWLRSFTFPAGGAGTIALTLNTRIPASASSASDCSPITYFTSNSTEKIFMGIGDSSGAVIASNTVSAGTFNATVTEDSTPSSATAPAYGLGGTSGIVVDNASTTANLANVYFTGLGAGNVTAAGSCKSFGVTGSSIAGTVTILGTGLNFSLGSPIVVTGFTGSEVAFNGTWTVSTVVGTTAVTYTIPTLGIITSSAGTASWGTCAFQLTQSGLS